MGLLRALAIALAFTGCYSPDLAQCRVACSSDTDCADGQTCNAEKLCAAEGVSCTAPADAAVTADTPLEPDALPQTMLRIRVMDQGEVQLAGHEPCTMDAECMISVDQGVPITLTAEPKGNRIFEKWEEACSDQMTNTCTLTPTAMDLKVTAKFKREM